MSCVNFYCNVHTYINSQMQRNIVCILGKKYCTDCNDRTCVYGSHFTSSPPPMVTVAFTWLHSHMSDVSSDALLWWQILCRKSNLLSGVKDQKCQRDQGRKDCNVHLGCKVKRMKNLAHSIL